MRGRDLRNIAAGLGKVIGFLIMAGAKLVSIRSLILPPLAGIAKIFFGLVSPIGWAIVGFEALRKTFANFQDTGSAFLNFI